MAFRPEIVFWPEIVFRPEMVIWQKIAFRPEMAMNKLHFGQNGF